MSFLPLHYSTSKSTKYGSVWVSPVSRFHSGISESSNGVSWVNDFFHWVDPTIASANHSGPIIVGDYSDECGNALSNVTFRGDYNRFVHLCSNKYVNIQAVNDGSYKDQHGTASWRISIAGENDYRIGSAVVPGSSEIQSAYRSELFGLYGISPRCGLFERR